MDLRDIISSPNTTLVDVRTESEFQSGNVPGSINIPLHEVPERVEEFKALPGDILYAAFLVAEVVRRLTF